MIWNFKNHSPMSGFSNSIHQKQRLFSLPRNTPLFYFNYPWIWFNCVGWLFCAWFRQTWKFNYVLFELSLGCQFLSQRNRFIQKRGGKLYKLVATFLKWHHYIQVNMGIVPDYLCDIIPSKRKTYHIITHEIKINIISLSVN